jgi:ribosomal protein L24
MRKFKAGDEVKIIRGFDAGSSGIVLAEQISDGCYMVRLIPRIDGKARTAVAEEEIEFAKVPTCETPNDPINRPAHYTTGKIECIDLIEAAGNLEGFCIGNTMKYLYRWKHKNGIEDLKKARWYLDRFITWAEKQEVTHNEHT